MGQVFLGQSPGGRLVAVKVIRPELADGPDFRGRFAREVAAALRVSGVFTAPVVDADPDAPQPWLVTAYVDGPSLADHIRHEGAMPESEVLGLGCALAEGLAAIHAAGIVHRDLKPSNVLLAADGPRIIDFGVSRAAEETALTQTGLVMGSPGFMSPEQAQGLEVSPASDVFSLGAVLAFAATGTDPFGTGAPSALMYRVVHQEPALGGMSGRLRGAIEACLRKNPAERPTTASLLAMFAAVTDGQSWRAARIQPSSTAAGPAGPGASPAQLSGRPVTGPGDEPARLVAGTHGRDLTTGVQRRRRRWPWVALAAAVVIAGGGGLALASHGFGTHKPPGHASGTSQTPRGRRTPRVVVEDYIAAINARNWPRVWRLGGKNLGGSYASMVAGFQQTRRDVILRLTADGDAVTVRIRAYEITGAVQVYMLSYVVDGGIIATGQQALISTRRPCPHIQYGADGTAGPLFCSNGQPNPAVLAYYNTLHLMVLKLGPDATPARVLRAMCADVRRDSTYPIESAAYDLAQKINGWSFGVSPPQEMLNGACR